MNSAGIVMPEPQQKASTLPGLAVMVYSDASSIGRRMVERLRQILFIAGALLFAASIATGVIFELQTEGSLPPLGNGAMRAAIRALAEGDRDSYLAAMRMNLAINYPGDPETLAAYADVLEDKGDLAGAIDAYERALAMRGAPLRYMARLARLYLLDGQIEKARQITLEAQRKGARVGRKLLRDQGLKPRKRSER